MDYEMKFFKVTINQRIAFIQLQTYPDNKYIVKFLNDEYSDFINSFKAFGFGVIAISNKPVKFELKGDVTNEIALEVWDNIANRLDTPDYLMNIEGFDKYD